MKWNTVSARRFSHTPLWPGNRSCDLCVQCSLLCLPLQTCLLFLSNLVLFCIKIVEVSVFFLCRDKGDSGTSSCVVGIWNCTTGAHLGDHTVDHAREFEIDQGNWTNASTDQRSTFLDKGAAAATKRLIIDGASETKEWTGCCETFAALTTNYKQHGAWVPFQRKQETVQAEQEHLG